MNTIDPKSVGISSDRLKKLDARVGRQDVHHDVAPFAMALKAVRKGDSFDYEPPQVRRQRVRPPRSIESRRSGESGGISLVIDHRGKVVAARVAPGTTGNLPLMMMSLMSATFKPASLKGVPVPSLLLMGGGRGKPTSQ